LFGPGEVMIHRFVVGYQVREDGPAVARPWPLARSSNPAETLAYHVQDLMR
jgi:hypothetical protein